MQRMPPNFPQRRSNTNTAENVSPALRMAERIRNEQGLDRARDYLAAMEPYLAPGERRHIAERLGVELSVFSKTPKREENSFFPLSNPSVQPPAPFNQSPFPPAVPFGDSGGNGSSFSGPGGNGMNNPMQLMQLFGSMNPQTGGMNGSGQMGQIMQLMNLMQLFGGMNKKK